MIQRIHLSLQLSCHLFSHRLINPVFCLLNPSYKIVSLMSDSVFDIEQDNNPSFLGENTSHKPINNSATNDQIGKSQWDNSLVNNSISVSNLINELLNSSTLSVNIINTEQLINSSVVVYLIQLRDSKQEVVVKRRYSEFKSLRDVLSKLHPTVIVPPIPEKHSIITYLLNSLNTDKEVDLIEVRKRYFNSFLNDLIFNADNKLKNSPLFKKFLDPNYELCWNNAINEPPVTNLPRNLLLANPVDPSNQNGLYLLLPSINGFNQNHFNDLYKVNLEPLNKTNDNLLKLNNQIKFLKFQDNKFTNIPIELIKFEANITEKLTILNSLTKFNLKHTKNFKITLFNLIVLGGNLNNFSLEINELNHELSTIVERFGSIMDMNYLNYESFLTNHFIPNWQENMNQLVQYYYASLNLINFYKFKILQFQFLFKFKFNKVNQLVNLNNSGHDLSNLKDLNSPSIKNLIKNQKTINKRPSWYKLFGGAGNKTKLRIDESISRNDTSADQAATDDNVSGTHSPESADDQTPISATKLEREIEKIDHLIDLCNDDLITLTEHMVHCLNDFTKLMEKKWLVMFLDFIKSTKQLFIENLSNWSEFKEFLS